MMNGKSVGVVIPSAGSGTRMGTEQPKQYLNLCGKPVIVHTLEAFQHSSVIDSIVIAVAKNDIQLIQRFRDSYDLSKINGIVEGGEFRQHSVWNGLQAFKSGLVDIVLVHDAVRPLIQKHHIDEVTQAAIAHGAAVLAVKVKDTLKVTGKDGFVKATPDRETLWLAQTPQAFQFKVLYDAFERAINDSVLGTDEAALVERLGVKVKVVEGDYTNLKITTPEDMELAEIFFKK